MNVSGIFVPRAFLTEQETSRALRLLTWQGMTATAMFSVVNSGFLASYALALGANNFQIGMLASIPFIMQPLQIPSILLVERLRLRKLITLITWYPAQAIWLLLGLIPIFVDVPSGPAVALLMGLMAVRSSLTAVMATAWNSWIRDIVPRETMGSYFARRLAYSTTASIIFGLGGALFVDIWRGQASSDYLTLGYTFVLAFGSVFLGMGSAFFVSLMPEPRLQVPAGPQPSILRTLSAPLRDKNYIHLMRFLLFWGFASNLAIPFFAVYMLKRLGLPLTVVIGFTVLSQLFNVLFLRVWGPMADRFGYKAVLSLAASLYLLVILGWVFTTMPEQYFLTIPLLVILHIFTGIAAAGVNLTVETFGLKLAPEGQATPYLVGASLATSLGAALGPLVGGRFADFFSVRELAFHFTWTDPFRAIEFPALFLTGYDFLFALAFLLGLITLNSLNALREEGEVSRDEVLSELMAQTREMSRGISAIPGLGVVASVPYSYLRHVPGMDVAIGVTAYQVASSVHTAITAAARGGESAMNMADRLGQTLTEAVQQMENMRDHGVQIAQQATRGAIHAIDEVGLSVGHIAKESAAMVLKTLGQTDIDLSDALRGIGYGAVQGASEVGADLGEAMIHAIEGAREAAEGLGLTQEQAATQVAQGALEATKTLAADAAAQVKGALLDEVLSDLDRASTQEEDEGVGDERV